MAITHKVTFTPSEEMEKTNPKQVTVSGNALPKIKKIKKFVVRDSFVATVGYVLVGADYSQMELRLIAHLSKDQILCDFLKSGGDVFKQIASHW